jgi:hypothetical protein
MDPVYLLIRYGFRSYLDIFEAVDKNMLNADPADPEHWFRQSGLYLALFRIRINLFRIRIQHFRLNTNPDPDPGFCWLKYGKKFQLKKREYPALKNR